MLKWMADTGSGGGSEEDYLSKLAQSILKKDRGAAAPPAGNRLPPAAGRGPAPAPAPPAPAPQRTAQPTPVPPPPAPATHAPPGPDRGWVRTVEMRDATGNFLPGTILIFEDGTVGIYKEFNTAKDYAIIYQLMDNGRAAPHGMPIHNYEVTEVGRISQLALEQLIRSNRWDRDVVVFHLLKFKDVAYVPRIIEGAPDSHGPRSSTIVSRLTPEQLAGAPAQPPVSQRPERGMRLRIDFGPGRSWDAVYWGKDELGHVVAHRTHDTWSLMHLDLTRFKSSIVWGDNIDDATMDQIAQDIATA